MKSPESELAALCETRLREFTAADSTDLTEFAECRLIVHGISPTNGEDVTQRALQLVLQGLETDMVGMHENYQSAPWQRRLSNVPKVISLFRAVYLHEIGKTEKEVCAASVGPGISERCAGSG